MGHELLERELADSARGIVHDTPQADLVCRIESELQVRENVLYLFALEKLHAADDTVRHALFAQRFFDKARLPIGPVEDGDVRWSLAVFAHQAPDLARDPRGFGFRSGCDGKPHGAAARSIREELFAPFGIGPFGDHG